MITMYFNNNSFLIEAIETPLQSLFLNKLVGWSLLTLSKRHPGTGVFLLVLLKFLKNVIAEHFWKAASET